MFAPRLFADLAELTAAANNRRDWISLPQEKEKKKE